MPSICKVKESFAFAGTDVDARQQVITQTTATGTKDWHYFKGLLLLQKLSAALDKTTTVRTPTDAEMSLINDMEALLKQYKNMYHETNEYRVLQARFYLLTWFINGDKSRRFIQEKLALSLPEQTPQGTDLSLPSTASVTAAAKTTGDNAQFDKPVLSEISDCATKKSYPTALDPILLDNDKVICRAIDKDQVNMLKEASIPFLQPYWSRMKTDQQIVALQTVLGGKPVTNDSFPIVSTLLDLWQLFEKTDCRSLYEEVDRCPIEQLTLDQMDELHQRLPVLLKIKRYVEIYMQKLLPHAYINSGKLDAWDVWDEDDLSSYLTSLDQFADKLMDGPFRLVKARVTFQKLRSTLIHDDFDESLLLNYLSQPREKAYTGNGSFGAGQTNMFGKWSEEATKRFSYTKSKEYDSVTIPLLGSCNINTDDEDRLIEEYLVGLIRTGKSLSLGIFGTYFSQKAFLEPLEAKTMLTSGLANDDTTTWAERLGPSAFDNLVKETILTFGPASLHCSANRLIETDPIPLHVTIKNIPRLTIRVFPIDLFNYWKLHPNDKSITDGNKLDVDGLCPIYEHQLDYSTLPSLRIVHEVLTFGASQQNGKAIAPDVFQGRGAWMIDFIGGRNQCRAIVQKGYLRHMVQSTVAGHIFLVMDENNQPMNGKCSIWLENNTYEPDASGNILIPYRRKDGKFVRPLLITMDGFCQPFEFYHEQESYSLDAKFYVNMESLIPTKQAKVVFNPMLTVNGQPLPPKLLEKLSLELVTTNLSGVKSSTTIPNLKATTGSPIVCEFTVPSTLTSIDFNLSGKVKTMSEEQPWQNLQVRRLMACQCSNDDIVTTELRVDEHGYFIQVLGKNGEPYKDKQVDLSFQHILLADEIDVTLQTNENGAISLGQLRNAESITVKNPYRYWNLLGDGWESIGQCDDRPLSCSDIHYYANTEFKIPYDKTQGSRYALFQTGFSRMPVRDFTSQLRYDESTIVVSGLPEGEYCLYLWKSYQVHHRTVPISILNDQKCTISNAQQLQTSIFWKNWMIGNRHYGRTTGSLIQQPLCINSIQSTKDQVNLKLKTGSSSSSTFAIITTSSFLHSEPLSDMIVQQNGQNSLQLRELTQSGLDHVYLTGRKLGEEYQYILNRTKAEKYVGSTLNEPTLLVDPEKSASTNVKSRKTAEASGNFNNRSSMKTKRMNKECISSYPCSNLAMSFQDTMATFGFLNQKAPILVLQANDQGDIVIDRNQLGEGNILQTVIFSGDQSISRTLVLSDADTTLQLNDQRQTDQNLNKEAAYLRNKDITILSTCHSQNTMTIDQTQQESELLDSQDALLDIFKLLAPNSANALEKYDIIRQWHTYDDEEKLTKHAELNGHELNLWIKYKDTAYFDNNVKPLIKNKIRKSFMDSYLIDADLTKYADDLYLFQQLNVMEKALLAKRVPRILPVVLRSFKRDYKPSLSDQPFDTVLAGNALAVPSEEVFMESYVASSPVSTPEVQMARTAHAPRSMALAAAPASLFGSPAARSSSFGTASFGSAPANNLHSARAAAPPPPPPTASDIYTDGLSPEEEREEDDTEADDGDIAADQITALREQAKRRRTLVPYEFIGPTSEWKEMEYYGKPGFVEVNQFWIDYLENNLDVFVSGNIIYATADISEMIIALALIDLPVKSNAKYEISSDLAAGKVTITATTPLMVFYRALKEYTETPAANPSLLLGQHFFEIDKNVNGAEDDQHIVEPTQLLPCTPYGWHLAVSNISTKTVICEITLQIPTGAVPLGETAYCQSKNVMIKPYTTWHEVVGRFYFPQSGDFHHFAVTVGEQQKCQDENKVSDGSMSTMVLVNQTQPLALKVTDMEKKGQKDESALPISTSSWSVVNSTGTAADVLAFVENHTDKLASLDWSLLMWRMVHPAFARSLLAILKTHKYYDRSLYAYAVYHNFTDIIADLLIQERFRLLQHTGTVFDSPLVKWDPYQCGNLVLDYYPIANARVHTLGASSEIANENFYAQYDRFLDYLNQSVRRTANDYVMFSIYLISQGRIGDAQHVYQLYEDFMRQSSTSNDDDNNSDVAAIQADYLTAYLATRVKVGDVMNTSAVKHIVAKYKTCGSLRWRKLFEKLDDYIQQVEQGQVDMVDQLDVQKRDSPVLGADPVFDFTIKDNQVVVRYANLTQMQVRFYNIDVEVMFSNQPFLNKVNKVSNYAWVKANHTETVDLTKVDENVTMTETQGVNDDFEWIGVSKVRPRHYTMPIPLSGNILVEVHAHGKSQCQTHFSHALTVHISEQFGIARVLARGKDENAISASPLAGVYVKVYVKLDNGRAEFWKDGYTSLTGVFDYISVTQGNGLSQGNRFSVVDNGGDLGQVLKHKVKKFALLFSSPHHGVVVKEADKPF